MYLSDKNVKLVQKFVEQNFQELNSEKTKTQLMEFEFKSEKIFEDLKSLKSLLQKDQYSKINSRKFSDYIFSQIEEVEYKILEKKISGEKVRSQEKVVLIILDFFGDDYIKKKDLIVKYLKNKFFFSSEKSVLKYLEDLRKSMIIGKLESQLKANKKTSGKLKIEDLDKMTGIEFEGFLKEFFEGIGFKVKTTKVSNDQGCDLILEKLGDRTSVQAKRYTGTIGNNAIQQVVGSLKYYDCQKALVITTSKFTKAAEKLAKANFVELWDREVLIKKIND
jgi:HJR/Mrr/RecB family endonuclease